MGMNNKETFETKYFTFNYCYDSMTEECQQKLSKEIKKYLKEHEEELYNEIKRMV